MLLAESSRASIIFGAEFQWRYYAKYEVQQDRDIQGGAESRGSSHDYSPRWAEGQGINKLKRPQPGKRSGVQMARVRGQGVIRYQVLEAREWLLFCLSFPKMIYLQEIQNILSGEAIDQNKDHVQ